jgi:dextranase
MLSTDKAAYLPGELVHLSLNGMPESAVSIRYTHLGKVLKEEAVTSLTWSWQPPAEDFQGYMAELRTKDSVIASIGIDVSSEPSRFPRNGFLSSYGNMSESEMKTIIEDLNRYHINYVQFQDWHWKHHHPLAGSATQPMDVWTDIISRNCYRATVQGYIDRTHTHGMVTLFYNLGYGCLEDFATDDVSKEWLLYTDKLHIHMDNHPLGSPFKSAIYLADMHNQGWRDYLRARNDEVYAIFNFDGWQIDQLGVRPTTVYDYAGDTVDVQSAFGSFIQNEKTAQPTKRIVMNAVGQYGQYGQIASAPVDFCYTEVWEHSNTDGYGIFSRIITDNAQWSNGKQTVLAAYLNYGLGQKGRGYFNTPGIIMATAAASAWGGTILQMGEHMLCHEYFPDDNLSMTGELKRAMIRYYDFAVAYENLLRPEAPASGINSDWYGVDVTSTHDSCVFNQWGPKVNQIATVGRHVGNRDIIHLLSYRHATHLDWCDTDGDQAPQTLLTGIPVSFAVDAQPSRVWVATPDYMQGAAQEVDFTYDAGKLSLTLPALQYWTMIVIEK